MMFDKDRLRAYRYVRILNYMFTFFCSKKQFSKVVKIIVVHVTKKEKKIIIKQNFPHYPHDT
jgi:hypothetical protein